MEYIFALFVWQATFCTCAVTGSVHPEISSVTSDSLWFDGYHHYLVMGVQGSTRTRVCMCVCLHMCSAFKLLIFEWHFKMPIHIAYSRTDYFLLYVEDNKTLTTDNSVHVLSHAWRSMSAFLSLSHILERFAICTNAVGDKYILMPWVEAGYMG